MKTAIHWLLIPALLLTGCSSDEEQVLGPDGKPVNSIDLTYVTDDFVGALVIHPARVLKSPLLQKLKDAGVPIEEQLAAAQGGPVNPETIKQVILLIDKESTEAIADVDPTKMMMGGMPPNLGKLLPTAIVSFSEPVKADELLAENPFVQPREVDGVSAHEFSFPFIPGLSGIIHMPDDKTLIFTKKSLLKKVIETTSASSPLITSLKGIDRNNDLMLVADFSAAGDSLKKLADQMKSLPDPDAAKFADVVPKLTSLTVVGGISGANLLAVTMTTSDEAAAKTLGEAFSKSVTEAKSNLERGKQDMSSQPLPEGMTEADRESLLAFMDKTIEGFTSSTDGTTARLTLAMPEGVDEMIARMKPLLENAQGASDSMVKKNDLKQIGLAFHNYHDVYKGFPGAGSNFDGTKQGLSWRVHLLPFLDEAALYDQFNLDEPWDSENNMALIEFMPEIFGSERGVTSIHVFHGEGTVFEGEKGLGLRDISDGSSNTLLVVQAGPSAAEIWTKPGGLDFDPEDPRFVLGEVGESFLGALCDGSVREFEGTISAEQLKALITRNGKEVIDF